MDAIVIAAPNSTKNASNTSDPGMHHPFHVIKNLFRLWETRYRKLVKNTAQLFILFGPADLVRSRDDLDGFVEVLRLPQLDVHGVVRAHANDRFRVRVAFVERQRHHARPSSP